MSAGPWVIARRLEDGEVEFLGNEDEWTPILTQAAVMASEQVAQRMVRELRADMRVVSFDKAQSWLVQGWLDGAEVGPPYQGLSAFCVSTGSRPLVRSVVRSVGELPTLSPRLELAAELAAELEAVMQRVEDLAARAARAELLDADRLAELEACADVLALVAAEARP